MKKRYINISRQYRRTKSATTPTPLTFFGHPTSFSFLNALQQADKPLEALLKALKLFLYLGISLGVVLILIYCGRISYYPSGLTLGDGFVFVSSCLSFSMLYTLFVVFQFCAGVLLFLIFSLIFMLLTKSYRLVFKEKNNKLNFSFFTTKKIELLAAGFLGLSWIFIVVLPELLKNFDSGSSMLFSIVVMFSFCCFWNGPIISSIPKSNDGLSTKKLVFLVGIILSPVLISGYQGRLLEQAMVLIGIRNENSSVQLQDKYSLFAKLKGLEPNKIDGKKKDGYYKNCKLLFRGIGTNVVIEINGVKLIIPKEKAIIGINKENKKLKKRNHRQRISEKRAWHVPWRLLT